MRGFGKGEGLKIVITLPGSIRSKKNSKRIFARGKMKTVLPSKAYLEWEKKARKSVNHQLLGSVYANRLLSVPLHVNAKIYFKGQQPDLSGCLESIGDCLEGIIWENDKQIVSWDGSRLIPDKKNPRTEIIIGEL